jgi:hypothetical protein
VADKQEPNREQGGQKSAAAAGAGAESESKSQTGDPGRTPGKAEGDEQTVDESLRQKENG